MRSLLPALLSSLALPAMAEAPKVMTDIVPVHALVAQVMEGVGTPELLLEAGADAHSFQLRPSQAAKLSKADLVVWIGPEMTPWLDRALDSLGQGARQMDLIHADGVILRSFADAKDGHADHGSDDDADGHGHGDDHAHDHSGTDPHVWLNPKNAALWLSLIAEELAMLDPENGAVYRDNASRAKEGLAAMDQEIAAQIAPVAGKPFVVFHDAYGYFTDHYGLAAAMAVAEGDAAAPGASHLSELRAEITAAGPICLFAEAQHDPVLIEQLAEGTEARIGGVLDPEGSAVAPGPGAYEEIMRGLGTAISGCLAP